jgi:hypothetical protein
MYLPLSGPRHMQYEASVLIAHLVDLKEKEERLVIECKKITLTRNYSNLKACTGVS